MDLWRKIFVAAILFEAVFLENFLFTQNHIMAQSQVLTKDEEGIPIDYDYDGKEFTEYILDEPSIVIHPYLDTKFLQGTLKTIKNHQCISSTNWSFSWDGDNLWAEDTSTYKRFVIYSNHEIPDTSDNATRSRHLLLKVYDWYVDTCGALYDYDSNGGE